MKNQTHWINFHCDAADWRAPDFPAPMMRRSFTLDALPASATLRFAAPGWAVVTINGQPVTPDVMVPTVTQLDKHTGYCEYTVTGLLQPGENVIGAILGNGWFNCATHEVWHYDKAMWRNYNRLYLELFADDVKVVASDTHWKCWDSPIIFNHLRSGEHFDARKIIPGWDTPGFDDSAWENARQVTPPPGILLKDDAPPCRVQQLLSPVKSWKCADDSTVYDFGKNTTGVIRLAAAGEAGAKVTIVYSELLAADGDIDRKDIARFILDGDLAQTDIYIHGETDNIPWQPGFVYHGFRYAKVIVKGELTLTDIKVCVIHSNFAPAGTMVVSHDVAQKVLDCTRNSYINNFTGIPTDCPHREKNGWTGDAHLACETGLWLYHGEKNYDHFLQILCDGQRPTGQLSGIAPNAGWGYNWGSGPVWDFALFELPYRIWQFTGSCETAKKYYPNMKKYLEYILQMRNEDGLFDIGLGDWCHYDHKRIVAVSLTSTAFVYGMLNILEEFATVFSSEDLAEYQQLKTEIKAAFIHGFRNPDGTYAKDEWTANACALYFKLDESPALAEHLLQQVRSNAHKADFGIVGAKLVPRVLAEYGYAADAFKLYTQTEYPGWGHWVVNGATSLYEHWNGAKSQDHIMFGDFPAWCFRYLAGIQVRTPGFRKIVLAPADIPEAGDFAFTYDTIAGGIKVEKRGDLFRYHLPEGIEFTLNVPEGRKTEKF